MSLLTRLQGYVPFLGTRKNALPREDMLSLRPVRNSAVTWEPLPETADDEPPAPPKVVLNVPRRADGAAALLARWMQVPGSKKIELDEFGGQIWALCDGAHSVEQLVKFTCETYKLNRRQGEISVVAFMRMLAQRRLVGFVKGQKETSHGSSNAGQPQRRKRGARRRN